LVRKKYRNFGLSTRMPQNQSIGLYTQ